MMRGLMQRMTLGCKKIVMLLGPTPNILKHGSRDKEPAQGYEESQEIPVTDLECIMRRRVSVGNLCNHNRFLLRECNVTDRVDIECNFAALGD